MKNSIVIPLATSKINHLDLRFVLRSIEKNVKNYKNIVIVGDAPDWIQNVDVVGCSDDPDLRWKERNILRKFQTASMSHLVTDNFLATNDDIVVLKEIDATDYPFYYKGTVSDSYKKNKLKYKATMWHTLKFLTSRGFPDRNYDTHCPIIYNKKKFLNSFTAADWGTPYGYGVKSIYCAVNRVDGVFERDVKITKKLPLNEISEICRYRDVISFTDAPLNGDLKLYLEQIFPHKSKYEQ